MSLIKRIVESPLVSRAALASLLIAVLIPSLVLAGDNPIIRMEGQSEMEVDLGMIVDDFLPILLGLDEAGEAGWEEQVKQVIGLTGIRSLDRMTVRSTVTARSSESRITITLDPDEQGFLPTLAAVPAGQFRFGRYLDPEGTLAVVSLQNFAEGLKALAGLVADAGIPNAPVARTPEGDIAVGGFNLSRELFPHIRGELDFILFPLDSGGSELPDMPNMAMVLGTPDGPALWEQLLKPAAGLGGEFASLRDASGKQAGDFTFYDADDLAFGVGPDFLIVTTDPERVMDMVSRPGRGIEAPAGRQYVRVDGDEMLDFLARVMESESGDGPEPELAEAVRRARSEEAVGVVEIAVSSRAGRIDMEVREPASLFGLEYRLIREMMASAVAMRERGKAEGGYRDMVAELDGAMTRYGEDHDGVFPEYPAQLVDDGYLEAFPDLTPTPLGEYVEGGFSYVTLRDDAGTVVGYFLLVYGGGEGTGFDLLTPENVAHPEAFHVASDGKKDGVVSFCYDGTAIAQVEAWRKESKM